MSSANEEVAGPHMTDSGPPTYAGMAHIAGGGPVDARCNSCVHFMRRDHLASLGRCSQHKRLSKLAGRKPCNGLFYDQARACKYYQENPYRLASQRVEGE